MGEVIMTTLSLISSGIGIWNDLYVQLMVQPERSVRKFQHGVRSPIACYGHMNDHECGVGQALQCRSLFLSRRAKLYVGSKTCPCSEYVILTSFSYLCQVHGFWIRARCYQRYHVCENAPPKILEFTIALVNNDYIS
jgi:hypothetical protein